MRQLPKEILKALDESGANWTLEPGKRHIHVRMNGRLVTIWPYGTRTAANPRQIKNVLCEIRKASRRLAEA